MARHATSTTKPLTRGFAFAAATLIATSLGSGQALADDRPTDTIPLIHTAADSDQPVELGGEDAKDNGSDTGELKVEDEKPEKDGKDEKSDKAAKAETVESGTWGTCPWELDSEGTLTIHPGKGKTVIEKQENGDKRRVSPWAQWAKDVKAVRAVEEDGDKIVVPADSRRLFDSFVNLKKADLSGMDTSQVKTMYSLFNGCKSLAELNISGWNTAKVSDMQYLFNGCASLEKVDVSGWNTSNVTDMGDLFYGCSSLTEVDVSKWDTSKVKDMDYLFGGCSALKKVDVSHWDTSSVTDMGDKSVGAGMFNGCSSLETLNVADWDTSKVTDMGGLFSGCSSLKELHVSRWDTSQVKNMRRLFSGCSAVEKLDVAGWDTAKVVDMGHMFSDCSALKELAVSDWDIASVKRMPYAFSGCSSLKKLDLTNWDTSSAKDMDGMFYGCSLDEYRCGEMLVSPGKDYEAPKSSSGEWWSSEAEEWLWKSDVSGRTGVADTYTSTQTGVGKVSSIEVVEDPCLYTGLPQTPIPLVKCGVKALSADSDYVVAYENNEEIGTGTVLVTGAGDYAGTQSATFQIVGDLTRQGTISPITPRFYRGSDIAVTPKVKVIFAGKALKEGRDYDVSFTNNMPTLKDGESSKATVTVMGKGNYRGMAVANFTIEYRRPTWDCPDKLALGTRADVKVTGGGRIRVKQGDDWAKRNEILNTAAPSATLKRIRGKKAGKTTLYLLDANNEVIESKEIEIYAPANSSTKTSTTKSTRAQYLPTGLSNIRL